MEPGLGQDRRQIEIADDGFRVALFDIGKATKLALDAVVIAVTVAVGADQRRVGNKVLGLQPFDDMYRKSESGHPGVPGQPVLQIEFGRGRILDLGDRTHIVVGRYKQMRLLAAHQVDIAHVAPDIAGLLRHPDQAGCAVAQEVHRLHRGEIVDPRKRRQRLRVAPAVAGLVEIEPHPLGGEIDDVGGARSVDIGQTDAARIEQILRLEPRCIVHRDLGAELAIADVGPVADRAVADADDVGKTVPGHVGQKNTLRSIGEDDRGAFLLVHGLDHTKGRVEPGFGQRGIPAEDVVLGDQHVGMAIAVEIDEAQIGIVPVHIRDGGQGQETLPVLVVGALVEAGIGPFQHHAILLPVAGEIEKLMTGRSRLREARQLGDLGKGLECRRYRRLVADKCLGHRAEIALVIPDVFIGGENALCTFTVEVEPLILSAIDIGREIGEAGRVNFPDITLDDGRRILKIEPRQRALEVASVALPDIPRLRDRRDEGRRCAFAVGELGAADQVVRRAEFSGEMMEHQHLATQPIGADVKTGAIARERILPHRPGLRGGQRGRDELTTIGVGGKRRRVALAIIEHRLEQPGLF